jgi:predicted cobalt transporter CbtA
MFRRILITALLAGFLGGLGISVVQEFTTAPIIHHAEEYESKGAAGGHKHGFLDQSPHSLFHLAQAKETPPAENHGWAPSDGLERTLYSTLANIITGIGFALILVACIALSGELGARQGWWLLCVAATAAGLWMLVFRHGAYWMVAGIVLLAAPHLIGAPQPAHVGGPVPPEIAGHFVAASLVTAAIFWCALGWLSGTFWRRLGAN